MNALIGRARRNPVPFVLCGLWLALMVFVLSVRPGMVSESTLRSILQFATILSLVSLGQTLVILAGGAGIDLSVGGNVSLSAVVALLALQAGVPGPMLPLACLLVGASLGAINGLLTNRLGIFPLVATLGTYYVYSGMALAVTGGGALSNVPDWALPWGRGSIEALPLPFITLSVPLFIVAFVLFGYTSWGRWIHAMGHNEQAARLVGIPVDRMRFTSYVLCGALAGMAAFVSLAWFGSGRPNIGVNLELESVTAVLLGGVAIFGGRGSVVGVIAAVLLIVSMKTVMLQFGINALWQVGVTGALLISVAVIDHRFGRGVR